MDKDEHVLSQEAIDALVSQLPQKPSAPVKTAEVREEKPLKASAPEPAKPEPAAPEPTAPKPATPKPTAPEPTAPEPKPTTSPPPTTPKPATTSFQKYTSHEVNDVRGMISDMVRQVSKISSALQRLDNLEEKIQQISTLLKFSMNSEQPLGEYIAELGNRLNEISQAQQNNTSSNIRDDFQCSDCQSKQLVAIHVKCTSCGNESWMGWWPEEKSE